VNLLLKPRDWLVMCVDRNCSSQYSVLSTQ